MLTGLQPTGELHIGNYFSAVRGAVALQEQGADLMVMIADLHSLTTQRDADALRARTLDAAALLLAAGLDPERSVLFAQSSVPRHAELCWVLSCITPHQKVCSLPQFREKSATAAESSVGLLAYPVLQAADVLVYEAARVPVGADQLQHLQLAAQLVKTFHYRFNCRIFPTPRPIISGNVLFFVALYVFYGAGADSIVV